MKQSGQQPLNNSSSYLPDQSLSSRMLGRKGEQIAATYFEKNGYSILARNFKARYGEIDIIAQIKSTLVFIEVKTRIDTRFGHPEEAVTNRKLQEVIKTSQYYLLLHPKPDILQRIDVIAILMDKQGNIVQFRHIPSVTS